ncbi:ATP-binding protein [Streptomyces acidiscabies]|uniref:ATP-binding protein n=1 Tax=Streptomyces acidiscabies TaxID=42234 RepID=UPI0038F7FCC9
MHPDRHREFETIMTRSVFPRIPQAIPAARKWAVRQYENAGGKQPDLCALLVSELATNAVEHAEGDRFEVTVWASLKVEVKDFSPKLPEPQIPTAEDENGRGLFLVSELASHFEVVPVPDGKISAFQLDEG